ncbi:MAG: S-layer homology domain-containing protein [Oscillospiraceae bacterium]|nr:S-layer homology domain-containing protein [Oscillospiraceae bacterium]
MGMKRALVLMLALIIALPAAAAADTADIAAAMEGTAQYVIGEVPEPAYASIGGEWAVLGLARSKTGVPRDYFNDYAARVEQYVTSVDGVLHKRKYTEYSRLIVALSAIGKDARDVGGYDMTKPLGDYEKTVWQGLNGPVWALLALDSADYPMPVCLDAEVQATRDMYVDCILGQELNGGGWTLSRRSADDSAEADMTAMALQALAKYTDREDVAQAVGRALERLQAMQTDEGDFSAYGADNVESAAQVIVALCELGIDPNDARFAKNGRTLVDVFLSYRNSDGGFAHTRTGAQGNDQMSAEQGLYTLAAIWRYENGESSLYRMTDAFVAYPGCTDVRSSAVSLPGRSFDDIKGHSAQTAIEALAERGIINGMTESTFEPDATMTRAQFAAITVRALGLTPTAADVFADVAGDSWYAPYVGTAYRYGIVKGRSSGVFDPGGTISIQEAAVMSARAAALTGLDTSLAEGESAAVIAAFDDGGEAASWAGDALAWCVRSGMLVSDGSLRPKDEIKRCEIAQMLYDILAMAGML